MIWFKIKELEKLLTEGKLSDKLEFQYLLTSLIIITAANYLSDEDPLWALWVHLLISLGAIIWGVRKSFEINQGGDNRDYLKRFISLTFVAGMRIVVFVLFVSFLIVVSKLILGALGVSIDLSSFLKEVLEVVAFFIFTGLYYNILLSSFKRVNSGDGSGIPGGAVKLPEEEIGIVKGSRA